MILINISHEAASMTAYGKLQLSENAQTLIGQVAASVPPLDMNKLGMVYITRIMGSTSGGTTRSVVLEQRPRHQPRLPRQRLRPAQQDLELQQLGRRWRWRRHLRRAQRQQRAGGVDDERPVTRRRSDLRGRGVL
ncbi:hypothetical protein GTP38_14440 [Duganella sp. FT94W]|uniref:Uncharacterized protein n=1 Tax=Duganella lactea TaxID=2692173 RepID=A0ABW9V797_9BURK|nr:hypothetical protein [Duganella lactea]MYM35531.1 hypothetical protein [Duganella lactea]